MVRCSWAEMTPAPRPPPTVWISVRTVPPTCAIPYASQAFAGTSRSSAGAWPEPSPSSGLLLAPATRLSIVRRSVPATMAAVIAPTPPKVDCSTAAAPGFTPDCACARAAKRWKSR